MIAIFVRAVCDRCAARIDLPIGADHADLMDRRPQGWGDVEILTPADPRKFKTRERKALQLCTSCLEYVKSAVASEVSP